jgi:hypothetical protein
MGVSQQTDRASHESYQLHRYRAVTNQRIDAQKEEH